MPDAATPGSPGGSSRRWPRYASTAARILLGLVFAVAGLNGFLNFLPQPKDPMPERAMAFAAAMMQTGYLLQLVSGTQLAAGALLLVGRFIPLALVLLAPVVVNILAFHLFLAPSGLAVACGVLALELHLAWVHRDAFRPLLRAKAGPR